jgi:hypothetical protein
VRIVSAAKYAALQARLQLATKELETASKRDAERQATITRQAAEIARLRDEKPDGPVQQPKPAVGDADLQRRLNLALRTIRELDERVGQMQDSHIADTRELHDLRQGAAS